MLALLGTVASQALSAASCTYTYRVEQLRTSEGVLAVEVYRPSREDRRPAVVMVHGSAGVYTLRGAGPPQISNFGEDELARACYFVVLPHYFDLVHEKSIVDQARLCALFPVFENGLVDVLEFAARIPHKRTGQVLLLGESYGGFLSVALAATHSRVVGASVFGTGLPDGLSPSVARLPPLLLQHGENDTIVPIAEAVRLQEFWKASGGPVKLGGKSL